MMRIHPSRLYIYCISYTIRAYTIIILSYTVNRSLTYMRANIMHILHTAYRIRYMCI